MLLCPRLSPAMCIRMHRHLPPSFKRIGNAIEKEKANPAGLAALRKNLPSHWEVTAGEHRYNLSPDPLSGLLRAAEKGKNAKSIAAKASEAAEWAFDLANQAKAYAGAQTEGGSNAKNSLATILSRREFGGVKGPSSWDLFRQRVIRWIENLLLRILGQIGRYPMGVTILFWVIIVGRSCMVGVGALPLLDEARGPGRIAGTGFGRLRSHVAGVDSGSARGCHSWRLSRGGSFRLLGGHQLPRRQ